MKILVIGSSNTFYIRSYFDVFNNMEDCDVHFLNNNLSKFYIDDNLISVFNYAAKKDQVSTKGSRGRILNKLRKIAKVFSLDDSWLKVKISSFVRGNYKDRQTKAVKEYILGVNPDIVFFFWGADLKYEKNIIEDIGLSTKTVLSVNTYPTNFVINDKSIPEEDYKYFNGFDGLIFPSDRMKKFFKAHQLANSTQKLLTNPDFIKIDKIPNRKKLEALNKVIFLGNVNFSMRTSDDIREKIVEIANLGLEVFVQKGFEDTCSLHPNIYEFEPFSYEDIKLGKLATFINENFDAVFYGYNSQGSLREELSITTRFSLCEFANIPIIIEKDKYLSLQEQFENSVDFIFYDKIEDLKKLSYVSKELSDDINSYEREVRISRFLLEDI